MDNRPPRGPTHAHRETLRSRIPADATWTPPKRTKTALEPSFSRPGTLVPESMKESASSSSGIRSLLNEGPNKSPVYDNLEYKLDDSLVAQACQPRRKGSRSLASYWKMIEKEIEEDRRKKEIIGIPADMAD